MKLNPKHLYILLAAMAMSISCSKQDNIQTTSAVTQTLADFDVVVDVGMTDYSEKFSTVDTRAASVAWKDGAEIAFALDGSAKPAGKLKYDAISGTWSKLEINNDATVKPEGGTVCALHADKLTIDLEKENAGCNGNTVYTDSGSYKVAKGVIYFTLNPNKRTESRLVISGVNAKAKVLNVKNKRLTSFAGMKFEEYDGSGEGTYDAATKTLTVEGCLADDGTGKTTIKIMYVEGANNGRVMTRIYERKAGAGQSITIKGPDDAEQSGSWTDAGIMPVSIVLQNPETGENYTDGQSLLCPINGIFADVVVLPDNAADKTFTVTSNPLYGDDGVIADRENISNNKLLARSKGTTTVTVTTSNGVKTTLKVTVIDKSIRVDGFRYEVISGGVKLAKPDLYGSLYGTVEPGYKGDVVIPATIKYSGYDLPVLGIGQNAFDSRDDNLGLGTNNQLTGITMGENMTFMDSYAVDNLPNLTKVKINKNMKRMNFDLTTPFMYCKNLATIEIAEGNEYFTVEDGVLYCRTSLEQNRHHHCMCVIPQYTLPVVINANTVEIEESSITHVQTTSIDIPSSVKDLGRGLFGGSDTKLNKVTLHWNYAEWNTVKINGLFQSSIINIANNYFSGHPALQEVLIYVPSGSADSYRYSMWKTAIKNNTGESRILGY